MGKVHMNELYDGVPYSVEREDRAARLVAAGARRLLFAEDFDARTALASPVAIDAPRIIDIPTPRRAA